MHTSMINEPVARIISIFIRTAASAIEKCEGDRFAIAAMLRCFAKDIEEGEYNDEIERAQMSYAEQLRFCSERGFICLEYHRRHDVALDEIRRKTAEKEDK